MTGQFYKLSLQVNVGSEAAPRWQYIHGVNDPMARMNLNSDICLVKDIQPDMDGR